ncbi:hypothetical protein POX_c03545 [Penicillium oxalicum]|uniref:Uncharacterized protein n=1 Tax=Penicillium oxalicum (strain 114-2 / CGMCC 5302) TaxID=933388 RepID=S8AHD2_PENO1|nr:hypothetical protein POX_c03545 [Penicillium oxalicum]EPS25143.1 hypothetical protein PDE_00074 [Penicillium oxalicum 114-2]KAI2790699.1 hypothetical protein POX_c03545 [Penicillium oxalicum]
MTSNRRNHTSTIPVYTEGSAPDWVDECVAESWMPVPLISGHMKRLTESQSRAWSLCFNAQGSVLGQWEGHCPTIATAPFHHGDSTGTLTLPGPWATTHVSLR